MKYLKKSPPSDRASWLHPERAHSGRVGQEIAALIGHDRLFSFVRQWSFLIATFSFA
jgi:hypothetical protein